VKAGREELEEYLAYSQEEESLPLSRKSQE